MGRTVPFKRWKPLRKVLDHRNCLGGVEAFPPVEDEV
jgi:hypothetical protein